MVDQVVTRMHQALNLIRPRMLPKNNSGVMAPNTNWKYASESVGKWNGMAVFAAELAWPVSLKLFVMVPGWPTKLSKKCLNQPTPVNWVCTPLRTPCPRDVAPNPIL